MASILSPLQCLMKFVMLKYFWKVRRKFCFKHFSIQAVAVIKEQHNTTRWHLLEHDISEPTIHLWKRNNNGLFEDLEREHAKRIGKEFLVMISDVFSKVGSFFYPSAQWDDTERNERKNYSLQQRRVQGLWKWMEALGPEKRFWQLENYIINRLGS